jgi:CRISPR-associated protein Cas1
MRKLLNTLYVTTPDAYLSLDGENVVVLKDNETLMRLPLHNLESVVTFGHMGASPALMGACAEWDINLCFMTGSGRFRARVVGRIRGNVLLRQKQHRVSDDMDASLHIAKAIIAGKLYNARWLIERATRDHPGLHIDRLKATSAEIKSYLDLSGECLNLNQLRGVEGKAAACYFNVFDEIILQQKDSFFFVARSRRPPLDRMNALLSFIYTLLANDVAGALETVGLDPYVGFLHRHRPGRMSLALDLMEELRPVVADRFVLSLVNKRVVDKSGFSVKENGTVLMNDNMRKRVLEAWQNHKQILLTHPFLKEKVSWGLVPYVQSLLLARYLRGDIDAYPPFFWK